MASRLSEVRNWSVLLVEAGPDEPAGAEVPSNFGSYLGNFILSGFFFPLLSLRSLRYSIDI